MANNDPQFEQRKRDHIRIALDPSVQSSHTAGIEDVDLIHDALPDLNFADVVTKVDFKGIELSVPFFISSMTAGHEKGREINFALARLSHRRQILMGVGSQRRELSEPEIRREWKELRKQAPAAILAGNIGISQAITAPIEALQAMVDGLEAEALFIHLNALQECLQTEGTPEFRGGVKALENIARNVDVPVIVKETGCGFSAATLRRLKDIGLHAVDLSGLGGTHWGRVEGQRAKAPVAAAFSDWGISTVRSLLNAKEAGASYAVWASGGVRTGVDVAKYCAMGAKMVGLALPFLEAAVKSHPDEALEKLADRLEHELKIAMFCTGSSDVAFLEGKWQWRI